MIAVGEGWLGEAEQHAIRAEQLNAQRRGGLSVQEAYAALAHARARWERGDLAGAAKRLDREIESAIQQDDVAGYVLGRILSSRIKASAGDRMGAVAELDRASVMPSGRLASGFFVERVARERARQALLCGDLVAAELAVPDWRQRLGAGAVSMDEHLLLVRFAIAAGATASRWLEKTPERVGVELPDRIQIGLLGALIALEERDLDRALDTLSAAMRLAAASGHRQMFLDERPSLGAVLDNAAARAGVRLPPRQPTPILGAMRDSGGPSRPNLSISSSR